MGPSSKKASPKSGVTKHMKGFSLCNSTLKVNGQVILSQVPKNVTLTPCTYDTHTTGCFLGFHATSPKSRHVAPLGQLKNISFTSIFRFKVWWTTLWTGSNGRDLETETQFLMLQSHPYVLFLPILQPPFRASLQPHSDDNVAVCVESGSSHVTASSFDTVVYLHAGDNPFTLVKEAMRVVRAHLGSFKPEGVREGVKGLVDGGCPPGFVLIDDGWQCISHDSDPEKEGMNQTVAGEQMPCRSVTRLREIKETF